MNQLRPKLQRFLTKPGEGKVKKDVMQERYKDFLIKRGILTHDQFVGRDISKLENHVTPRTKGMPKNTSQMSRASRNIDREKAATPGRARKQRVKEDLLLNHQEEVANGGLQVGQPTPSESRVTKDPVLKDGRIQAQIPSPSTRVPKRSRDGTHRALHINNIHWQDDPARAHATHHPSSSSASHSSPSSSSHSIVSASHHRSLQSTIQQKSQHQMDAHTPSSSRHSDDYSASPGHHSGHLTESYSQHDHWWPHQIGYVYQPLPDSPRFSGDLGHMSHIAQHDNPQYDPWHSL
jgi:hypothetical protein